jgi:ubiquinone/menaquinone biosynthesis C-methylase UbiE
MTSSPPGSPIWPGGSASGSDANAAGAALRCNSGKGDKKVRSNLGDNPASVRDGSPDYTLVTGDAGAARLALLHEVYGRSTEVLLTELGLAQGMRAVDLGCGTGTVSRWMAERVGGEGAVVGVDVSSAQLEVAGREAVRRGFTQLEFRQADAYAIGLPRDSFDLVYCRFLLCHLARPEHALQEMRALLKPGGWLVCDDVDVASIFADPASVAVDRMRDLMRSVGAARGVDYCLGIRLHRLFRSAGFSEPRARFDQPVYATGPEKRIWEYTFLEMAPAVVQAGLITPAELEDLAQALARVAQDGTIMVAQARKVQVWARR